MSEHIVSIPADDQQRIDEKVAEFRHALEWIYQLGHIQGQIEMNTKAVKIVGGNRE